jgi:hypothetical protein
MRPGEPICERSPYPLYDLSAQGKVNMDFHIAQSSRPVGCQVVVSPLLRSE